MADNEVVVIAGMDYTKRACYVRALEIDPTSSTAWANLGSTMADNEVVAIAGVDYTQRACYVRALEIDPR